MAKMKRNTLIVLLFSMIAVILCAFMGCTDNGKKVGGFGKEVYIVSFHSNDENATVTKAEVEPGKTVTVPASPVRVGYTFVDWFLSYEDDASEAFDAAKPINSNITVYAKWQKDASKSIITLVYNNYFDADTKIAVDKGSVFVAPETPVYNENKTYDFVGWKTADGDEYDFSSKVDADITLYANWTKAKATVKIYENYSGADVRIQYVKLGEKLAKPETPERDMYEFGNWYTEAIGGSVYDFNSPVTEDVTIYAHWKRSEYSVTFNANGAKLPEGTETVWVIKTGQSAVEQATAIETAMTYTGRDFAGWYTIQYGEEETADPKALADLTGVNDDLILFAKWELHPNQVAFNWNYEDCPAAPDTQIVKYGKFADEPEAIDRNGFTFAGWFTDAACSEDNVFTFDMKITADMTLYAKWVEKEDTSVTVTFKYDNNGTFADYETVDVPHGAVLASYVPEKPTLSGYMFEGWYTNEALTREFNVNGHVTENLVLYGKMLQEHIFEAEAVDFNDKKGIGGSSNSYEEQMIQSYVYIKDGSLETVSNGYFVRELYYPGAYLEFVIESDKTVTDAMIYLRVTGEVKKFTEIREFNGKQYGYLTDQEFMIWVNDKTLDYGGLYVPMPSDPLGDKERGKTPFEDMFIALKVTLGAGENSIVLEVNNNKAGSGSYRAEAPAIDCLKIYANANLTMHDYEYYKRSQVDNG